jgi:hypothetical protein
VTDQELRALVRDAVQRHLGAARPADSARPAGSPAGPAPSHPSHALYITLVNAGDACVIESTVPCEHCGYCKSHGH